MIRIEKGLISILRFPPHIFSPGGLRNTLAHVVVHCLASEGWKWWSEEHATWKHDIQQAVVIVSEIMAHTRIGKSGSLAVTLKIIADTCTAMEFHTPPFQQVLCRIQLFCCTFAKARDQTWVDWRKCAATSSNYLQAFPRKLIIQQKWSMQLHSSSCIPPRVAHRLAGVCLGHRMMH